MRYDGEHKKRTHERLLQEAAKAMRAQGPHKIGVAEIMAKAGLTHGGFYAHFASREDFVTEAIGQMFKEAKKRLPDDRPEDAAAPRSPAEILDAYVNFYLSRAHRDERTSGCPLPFLTADAPRLPAASRERYAEGVARLSSKLRVLLEDMGHPAPQSAADSALSEMVGAVALSRAEPDTARADAILAHSKRAVKQRLGLELEP